METYNCPCAVSLGANKWSRPDKRVLKCNVHFPWANSASMCGGAWIVHDYIGEVRFHAWDAFVHVSNRISADLRCIIWTLYILYHLKIYDAEVWLDNATVNEAINNPNN